MTTSTLLQVSDLTIRIGDTVLVERVSFELSAAGSFGLVGESGSGKTLTLKALTGLLPRGFTASGSILLDGEEILGKSERAMSSVRGAKVGLVLQDPLKSLNPIRRIGPQIAEAPRLHLGLSRAQARERTYELMRQVGLPDPRTTARRYPHQLSGGMRQRAMIAIALSCEPKLILCDEPTTALDVTVQAQVLALLHSVCREQNVAMVFVSHDLAVVRQVCTTLAVMYAGRLVETGGIEEVFADPRHGYTASLLSALPDIDNPSEPRPISGELADPRDPPGGCRFHPRCPVALPECSTWPSQLQPVGEAQLDRRSACVHAPTGLPESHTGGIRIMQNIHGGASEAGR
jgi:oligopeptide/dipeptide ABC transporter ATP-binding protein